MIEPRLPTPGILRRPPLVVPRRPPIVAGPGFAPARPPRFRRPGFADSSAAGGPIFNDTFTEASDTALGSHTPDTGTGWTVRQGSWNVIASTGHAKSNYYLNFSVAEINDALATNQYVEANTYSNSDYHGLVARHTWISTTDNFTSYALMHNSGTVYLYRRDGTSWTLLDSAALTFSSGEVLRLECSGTSIIGKVDGATTVSATDSTYSGGGAGLRGFSNSGEFDNFTADNL